MRDCNYCQCTEKGVAICTTSICPQAPGQSGSGTAAQPTQFPPYSYANNHIQPQSPFNQNYPAFNSYNPYQSYGFNPTTSFQNPYSFGNSPPNYPVNYASTTYKASSTSYPYGDVASPVMAQLPADSAANTSPSLQDIPPTQQESNGSTSTSPVDGAAQNQDVASSYAASSYGQIFNPYIMASPYGGHGMIYG